MGGKSQPNYRDAAVAQGEANEAVVRDQTYANRPTQYTPWGYTTWNPYEYTDPGSGETTTRWEQVQGLTPELQDVLNKQIAVQSGRSDVAGALTGQLGAELGRPMDWGALSPMGQVPMTQMTLQEGVTDQIPMGGLSEIGNPYETRRAAEDAVYNQAMSRLQPAQESEISSMEVQLRNRGLRPGDAAYQSAMQGLNQKHSDQQNQALWSANQAGRDESGQMFNQQLQRRQQGFGERQTAANFFNQAAGQRFGQAQAANQQNFNQMMQQSAYANQLRQQQIAENLQRRGASLNEINALLSGQQVGMPQMPSFTGAQAAQAAPIYQGAVDQANYNAATSPWNAVTAIAGGAAGSSGFWNMF